MSTVLTTDWLIVSRGGKPYRCHVSDFLRDAIPVPDLPSAKSLVLSDVPGGNRFTGVDFPLSLTMDSEGTPVSTKGLRAWVTGKRTFQPVTDTINAINTDVGPTYSNWLSSNNGWEVSGTGVVFGPDRAFNGVHSPAWDQARTPVAGTITFSAPSGFFKGPVEVGIDCDAWPSGALTVSCNGAVQTSSDSPAPGVTGRTTRNGITANWFDLTGDFTEVTIQGSNSGLLVYGAHLSRIIVNGVELLDNAPEPRLTFATDKDLAYFKAGEVLTQDDNLASGTILSVNKVSNAITLTASTGTWAVGRFGRGPTVTEDNVVQYCVINSSGVVSALQDGDPGYVDQTATPTTLNFPATFTPSGVPDTVLPAGTSLTAEVRARNTHGDSIVTSNSITPV